MTVNNFIDDYTFLVKREKPDSEEERKDLLIKYISFLDIDINERESIKNMIAVLKESSQKRGM